jgi:tetratricopeptide (TPR) repeat protein
VYERVLQADRLLAVDLVEQAEAIYREVADRDPLHAIAIVGLARCALARGDDRGAYELAARALAIDPDDDMARRMEARLAEVLALRGDVVERPMAAAGGGRPMRQVVAGTPAPAPARRRFLDRLRDR